MSEKEGKSTAAKWLTGCGIGCGVIVLLGIIAAAMVYYAVKDTVNSFQELEESRKILTERFGSADEYCPEAQAGIPADRMKTFMEIRESMLPAIQEMQKSYETIENEIERANQDKTQEPGFWEAMGIIKSGFSIPGLMGKFYGSRNRKMVELNMSPGEYLYIYSLAYYSYLGHEPADGLDFSKFERKHKRGKVEFSFGDSEIRNRPHQDFNSEEFKEMRRKGAINRLRGFVMPKMRCQLSKLNELSDNPEGKAWAKTLEAELDALDQDPERIPWQDGLPEGLKESFEPHKERLNATYSKVVNMMEYDIH